MMAMRSKCVSGKTVWWALFCLLSLWGFAVACGDQGPPAGEALSGPVWKDAETDAVLFTIDDVAAFDWENQFFVLELEPALDFLAWMVPHKYQTRELLVEDEDGLIYRGRWVSPISSVAFWGPIYVDMGMSRFFLIGDGYPGFSGMPGDMDERYAPRLHTALERKGVLCQLDPNQVAIWYGLDCVRTNWHQCGDDLRVRAEFFPDTFRVGRDARAHIFFSTYPYERVADIDSLRVEIKLVADQGRYRSDVQIDDIPVEVVAEGIYACRFRPWTPCPGSTPAIESPGTAYISLSVLLCRQTESEAEIVRRLEFPEQTVSVLLPPDLDGPGGE